MSAEPAARCLDLSRLVSRLGQGPWTGVDRVEAAYLARLMREPVPLWSLVRMRFGYALLAPEGTHELAGRLFGGPWGRADLAARLTPGLSAEAARAEADLRRLARRVLPRPSLARTLRKHLPAGTSYVNVGHSNLTARVLIAWRSVPDARISVMIHDTIPLDLPEAQRDGSPERFAAMLSRVGSVADLAIYNSAATRDDAERHFAKAGRVPPGLVAHLGVPRPEVPRAMPPLPPDLAERPFFLCLGTIEPRKNHALLLDVWESLPSPRPILVIAGRRGWKNADVFARLDRAGADVLELPGLPDSAVTWLMAHACALLFPSRAEGFGLPALEAAALGTPVIASDLPVFRELLGDYPSYLPLTDPNRWAAEVSKVTMPGHRRDPIVPPSWQEHFNAVLSVV
ncbi:glycosyltransferase family 1 protein [Tropicimonas sp. IMCC34011]|uniref:glycosyltransferase family 4 protein n=1 Tax=Tropicimonas sp. IMCC34011 TaxID=2248759 RepID=UPI001E61E106|nr:glycosyltransferase family 1 protein [Tropicimonas sp. IMCC34011]